MEKHLINENLKYVIATFNDDEQVSFLHSLHQGRYEFVYDITQATKTKNRQLAEQIVEYYHSDTGDQMNLVVLPLLISYTLIEE